MKRSAEKRLVLGNCLIEVRGLADGCHDLYRGQKKVSRNEEMSSVKHVFLCVERGKRLDRSASS